MTDLCECLTNNKIFFGKPAVDDYISNSGLSEIKRILLDGAPFHGNERQFHVGGEVHLRALKRKKSKRKWTAQEKKDIEGMVAALRADPFFKWLMSSAVCEKPKERTVMGVKFMVILDIKGIKKLKGIGADIKTTSCKTHKDFVQTAIKKWDYLRQGWIYKQAEGLKDFYFIGVQKTYPYKVFILDVADYAKEEQKIANETVFLLELFKQFGRAFDERRNSSSKGTNRKRSSRAVTKSPSNSQRKKRGTGTKTRSIHKGDGRHRKGGKHIVWKGNYSGRYIQNTDSSED